MQKIQVIKGKVGVALGDGIAFLEQVDICGATVTLIVSTKQLSEITLFLRCPNSRRLRVTDQLLEPVTVTYSKDTDKFVIEQGGLKVIGAREDAAFG